MLVAMDLTGERYGRLTVIRLNREGGVRAWLCRCDCGEETTVVPGHLRSGNTTSCGCRKRTVLGERTTKHGHGREGKQETTYRIWKSMRNRCNNKRSPRYKDYGGRGIKVCLRWDDFQNFLDDMGARPKDRSLDRIDNDGDYTPENCRWATSQQQSANQRTAKYYAHEDKRMHMSAWAREFGVTPSALCEYIKRHGWSNAATHYISGE